MRPEGPDGHLILPGYYRERYEQRGARASSEEPFAWEVRIRELPRLAGAFLAREGYAPRGGPEPITPPRPAGGRRAACALRGYTQRYGPWGLR